MRVNRDGARNVAEAAATVVYVSSDYVRRHQGRALRRNRSGQPAVAVRPFEGRGERATAEANPRHHIVRTSGCSVRAGCTVDTMLRIGAERDTVRVVDDQVGQPTYTAHLAYALLDLAGLEDFGIHHVSGQGKCSWYELARYVFEKDATARSSCAPRRSSCPAPRPAYSVCRAAGVRRDSYVAALERAAWTTIWPSARYA